MSTKSGIVMKIENSTLYLMTSEGEFVKVRLNKKESLPMIGSEYCGEVIKPSFIRSNIFKYASVASLMIFTLFGGGGAYAYYKPVSTITISANSSIELKSNMWGKVISANPINENGKKILQEISLKNKTVEDALLSVLDQSKKDKFIDDNYIKNNIVQISIKGKELSLASFEKKIDEDALSVKVDNNGTIIYNKSSKNENGSSSGSKKDSTNNSEKHNSYIDKNSSNDNTVDDNLPVKNEDKQKNQKSDDNSNKNNKVNYKNSSDLNYDANDKSDDTTIYKNNNNSDIISKYNNTSEEGGHKNSNNNGNYSKGKNKKDKKDKKNKWSNSKKPSWK